MFLSETQRQHSLFVFFNKTVFQFWRMVMHSDLSVECKGLAHAK